MVSETIEIINIDVVKVLDQLGISAQKFQFNNQVEPSEWTWNQAQKAELTKVLKAENHDQTAKISISC